MWCGVVRSRMCRCGFHGIAVMCKSVPTRDSPAGSSFSPDYIL